MSSEQENKTITEVAGDKIEQVAENAVGDITDTGNGLKETSNFTEGCSKFCGKMSACFSETWTKCKNACPKKKESDVDPASDPVTTEAPTSTEE